MARCAAWQPQLLPPAAKPQRARSSRSPAISGPRTLLRTLRVQLIGSGWTCTRTTVIHLKPREESLKLGPQACPVTPPRSPTTMMSGDQSLQVDLDVITSQFDANQQTAGTSLDSRATSQALRGGQPVLMAVLQYT